MKMVSWNVNGLRACLQKGFLDEFQKLNADFFCLQETKLSEGQLTLDLPGYYQYWCYAEKKGYSGTAVFTRHEPLAVRYGIGVPALDNEGRVITLEYREFYLVNCYTPNAQRELARIGHRIKWDEAFRAYLRSLDAQKPVILCGDLNVAHREIDLKNPAANRKNAGFSDEERASFQQTLDLGFTDTFRHLHPDTTGAYSWWSYMFHAREKNAGWRIDYFLVSNRIRQDVYRAEIHSDIFGSDHCPVSIHIDTLVNGSLYTHEAAGSPSVTEQDARNTKSSAVTAKGFVLILPVLLLLLAVTGIVDSPINHQNDPQIQYDVKFYTEFEIHLSSFPFATSLPTVALDTDQAVFNVIDDQGSYYVTKKPNTETSDIFIRITARKPVLDYASDQWSISLTALSKNTDTQQMVELTDLIIVPYYTDPSLTNSAGWLLSADVQSFYPADFLITIAHNGADTVSHQIRTLTPYLSPALVDRMTTAQLVNYCALHPGCGSISLLDEFYIGRDHPVFTDLKSTFLPFSELTQRQDLVVVLMSHEVDQSFSSALLAMDSIRRQMTPEQESQYLTHHYRTATQTIDFESVNSITTSDLTTGEMLDVLHQHGFLEMLARCRSKESTRLVVEYLSAYSRILHDLSIRSDVVDALMRYTTLSNQFACDRTPMSAAIHNLLSLPQFRSKMTPQQEASFLMSHYPASDFPGFECPEVNLSNKSAQELYSNMLDLHSTEELITACTTPEAIYYVYMYMRRYNPYIDAFFDHPDAESFLLDGSSDLLRLYYFRDHEELFGEDPHAVLDFMMQDEAFKYDLRNSPALPWRSLLLIHLLRCKPNHITATLEHPCTTDTEKEALRRLIDNHISLDLTLHEQALILTDRYSSAEREPLNFADSKDDLSTWSTGQLVDAIADDPSAFVYFSRTERNLHQEILSILSYDSAVLRQLLQRDEALQTFRQCSRIPANTPGYLDFLNALSHSRPTPPAE